MITKNIDISIPLLWGAEHFIKNEWGYINYLVGANGTGKSLLAEQIKNNFSTGGFTPRYLNAERLMGLEKSEVGYYGGASLTQGFNISNFQQYKSNAEKGGLSHPQ